MYKVNQCRNIFNEIESTSNKVTFSTSGINSLGLRSWFDITKPLNELLSLENTSRLHDNLRNLRAYFKKKYKLGEFPDNPTIEYLAEYSNFSTDSVKKLFSNTRGCSRDFLIGICFAFRLNIIETNLLLKSAGYNELYDRDPRDIIIIKSIFDNFINTEFNCNEDIPIIYTNKMLIQYTLQEISSDTSKLRKR